jgi:hypothetical protein
MTRMMEMENVRACEIISSVVMNIWYEWLQQTKVQMDAIQGVVNSTQ